MVGSDVVGFCNAWYMIQQSSHGEVCVRQWKHYQRVGHICGTGHVHRSMAALMSSSFFCFDVLHVRCTPTLPVRPQCTFGEVIVSEWGLWQLLGTPWWTFSPEAFVFWAL